MVHVGIIPDGNRRYAEKMGLSKADAYTAGFTTFKHILESVWYGDTPTGNKVTELTVFVCSRDNIIKRSTEDVACIEDNIQKFINYYYDTEEKILLNEICITLIGDLSLLSPSLRDQLVPISNNTKNNSRYVLNLAMCYDPIIHLCNSIDNLYLTPKTLYQKLIPRTQMDIVIRTGFEKRTSGFFPLHTLYSEWFFIDAYFPELNESSINNIIEEYYNRNRRYGA